MENVLTGRELVRVKREADMAERGICVECGREMNIVGKGLCGKCYAAQYRKAEKKPTDQVPVKPEKTQVVHLLKPVINLPPAQEIPLTIRLTIDVTVRVNGAAV
jgi:hypothetical protein